MQKKINVLQSLGSLEIGGNEVFVMNYYRHMDKNKFHVDFIIYDDDRMDFYDEIIESGSKVYICKSTVKNKFLRAFAVMYKVSQVLKKNHYDIIHCHSCSFTGIFRGAVPGHLTRGVKVIVHSHNPGNPKKTFFDNIIRSIAKEILSKIADFGCACSDSAGESKYTKRYMNSGKYKVINNAIDQKKFYYNEDMRNQIRGDYGILSKFVIGSVGRLENEKNYLFMLDVMEQYVKYNEDAIFLLIGDGSQAGDLENGIVEKNLNDHVLLLGRKCNPEVYYSVMDLFVLPSIYEGFGFVNIEAQVSGLPCIVSKDVPREIDISGRVDFLECSVSDWCSAIDKIYKEHQKNKNVRRSLHCSSFDLKDEVKVLEKIYIDLLCDREKRLWDL